MFEQFFIRYLFSEVNLSLVLSQHELSADITVTICYAAVCTVNRVLLLNQGIGNTALPVICTYRCVHCTWKGRCARHVQLSYWRVSLWRKENICGGLNYCLSSLLSDVGRELSGCASCYRRSL